MRLKRYSELALGYKLDALGAIQKRMGRIIIHRTGYGPFVNYLRRFSKKGTPTYSYNTP